MLFRSKFSKQLFALIDFNFSGAYYRTKRSLSKIPLNPQDSDLLTVLDSISLIHKMEDSLFLVGLKTPLCKLRAVCEIYQKNQLLPEVESLAEGVMEVVESLRWKNDSKKSEKVWLEAAKNGESERKCKYIYKCEPAILGDRDSELEMNQ